MSGPAATGVVTLLTDFGLSDPFVGIMKGVMLRAVPELTLVDLSHGIPPQDIEAASFTLVHGFSWFAPGTVHLCVVDPGVGSARAPIAVRARGHLFVGPDNGLFDAIIDGDPAASARRIDTGALGLSLVSRTFHGRDVFAPVAAALAGGHRRFEEVGPPHPLPERPEQTPSASRATGKVVWVDHFGNLISDIPAAWVRGGACSVELGGHRVRCVGTYSDAEPGECVALVSSFDTLEIAQRDGNAARALSLCKGQIVRVVPHEAP